MPKEVIDADDGYLTVEAKQTNGPPLLVQIDLFEATNTYAALHAQYADPIARANAWVEWLANRGLPPVSHGAAFALAGRMNVLVEEYAKKKPGIVSESTERPASTGSPSPP